MNSTSGLIVGFLVLTSVAAAPGFGAVWAESFTPPGAAVSTPVTVKQAAGGDLLVVGTYSSPKYPNYSSGLVTRVAPDGSVRWSKQLSLPNSWEALNDFAFTADGGLILVGTIQTNTANPCAWVVKMDGAGTLLWQQQFSCTGGARLNAVIQTDDNGDGVADDGYVVTGQQISQRLTLVTKLDPSGAITWANVYGGGTGVGNAITQTSDGGFAFAASSTWGFGTIFTGYYIGRLDRTGNPVWQARLQPVSTANGLSADPYSIWETADHGLLIAGSADFDPTNLIQYAGWVVKLTASGTTDWQREIMGEGGSPPIVRAAPTGDGGMVVTGENDNVYLLLRLDPTGSPSLQREYSCNTSSRGTGVVATSDGGYALTGVAPITPAGASIWTLRLDSTASISFAPFSCGSTRTPIITWAATNVPAVPLASLPMPFSTTSAATSATSTDVALTLQVQSN
ncbi:MAG TPA: hypothetical protein VI653_24455 [Steroidobacteraceae bacterium]